MIPGFRDKVMLIHIEKSEYAIIKEEQVGAVGGQARYFALTTMSCASLRIPVILISHLIAVDKLLAAAGRQNKSDSSR